MDKHSIFLSKPILALFASTGMTLLPNWVIAEELEKLNTVVVTATGFKQELKEAPASISVVTREELENKSVNNLGDALANIEGIDVTRGGKAGGMNISIRGMSSNYTLILINGKRLNQSSGAVRPNGFGDVDTNFIPPISAIERIEIIRGPMSTLYGSDAMGGVINIITRKIANEWSGNLKLTGTYQFNRDFGDNGSTQLYISGPLRSDLFGLAIRGNLFHRDKAIIDYTDKNGTVKRQGFSGLGKENNYILGTTLSYSPTEQQDWVLDIDTFRQDFDNKNSELGTLNSAISAGKAGGGYKNKLKFNRERYALSHTGRWSFGTSDSSILYDTTDTVGRINPVSSPAKPTDGTDRTLRYDNLNIDTKLTLPLFDDQHLLTIGGQYWQQKLKDTLVENPQHQFKQYQGALFLEDEWLIFDPLTLTLGLRYDNNQKFGDHWSPRSYLVWTPNSTWTLKGGISQGYKTPQINQMVDGIMGFGQQGTLPLLGNAKLTPEKSTTTEIGVIYDNPDLITLNTTLFQTRFKNQIAWSDIPNCLAPSGNIPGCTNIGNWVNSQGQAIDKFSQATNIDKSKIEGLEIGSRLYLSNNLTLSTNYTYLNSKQLSGKQEGYPLQNQPKHAVNARLQWQITEGVNTWIGWEYRSHQFRGVKPNGESAYYSSYALTNLGASYKPAKWLTLNTTLNNVFNKSFINYKDDPTNPKATSYTNTYYRVEEGRRLWLSASVDF